MVNKALSERVEVIQQERQEKMKEIDARKEQSKATKGFPKRFYQVSGKPFYITFLHSYDKALNISVHTVKEKDEKTGKVRYRGVICRKQYAEHDPIYEKCPICDTRVDGKKNSPVLVRAFLGWVHNFEGETFTPEGSDKTYDITPLRVVEVRFGKGSNTINELSGFVRKGVFNKKIFEQKKVGTGTDTQYLPLTIADPEMLGEEVNPNVPKEVFDEHMAMDEDQIAQRILAAYDAGVIWALWEVDPPSETIVEEPVTAVTEEPAVKGASKKALG